MQLNLAHRALFAVFDCTEFAVRVAQKALRTSAAQERPKELRPQRVVMTLFSLAVLVTSLQWALQDVSAVLSIAGDGERHSITLSEPRSVVAEYARFEATIVLPEAVEIVFAAAF